MIKRDKSIRQNAFRVFHLYIVLPIKSSCYFNSARIFKDNITFENNICGKGFYVDYYGLNVTDLCFFLVH